MRKTDKINTGLHPVQIWTGAHHESLAARPPFAGLFPFYQNEWDQVVIIKLLEIFRHIVCG